MTAVTATWGIPYATSTDRLCDGCTITEDMAERVDDILNQFDISLAASEVVPLARASRQSGQDGVQAGTLEFTAVDFDTTGIGNLATPTAPIMITQEGRWMMGTSMLWDNVSLSSGTNTVRVNSVNGLDSTYGYRQRVPGGSIDTIAALSWIGGPQSIYPNDLIYGQGPPGMRIAYAYVWAWRIGDSA